MRYAIGIDIGGTKCAVTLGRRQTGDKALTYQYEIIDRKSFKTKEMGEVNAVLEAFMRNIDSYILNYDLKEGNLIDAIGISCGGPLDSQKGIILSPPNLPGWDNVPIVDILKNRYQVPVILENDANACAVAEWQYGAGRGTKNMIFLTFGTGLGAGLILDNHLYSGTNGMAGEVGHIRLSECGPVGYGKMGSFEGFCSGGGIAQLAKLKVLEQLGAGITPPLYEKCGTLENLTALNVALAAKEGDTLAQEIYAMCGTYLGKGLAFLIDILNPECIVIGSIFERSKELLWEHAKKVIDKECLVASKEVCKVVPAGLGDQIGDYAAMSLVTYYCQEYLGKTEER
jgi:glucokinase